MVIQASRGRKEARADERKADQVKVVPLAYLIAQVTGGRFATSVTGLARRAAVNAQGTMFVASAWGRIPGFSAALTKEVKEGEGGGAPKSHGAELKNE